MIDHVSNLPDALADRIAARNLIIFDGECVLCSSFYRFVLRYDRDRKFAFATAQSDLGQALYGALNLPTSDFETNLVIVDAQIYAHLASFAAVMGQLHWPWRGLGAIRLLPSWIKSPVYKLIARNRFRILGRKDTCLMPDGDTRKRFIEGGW